MFAALCLFFTFVGKRGKASPHSDAGRFSLSPPPQAPTLGGSHIWRRPVYNLRNRGIVIHDMWVFPLLVHDAVRFSRAWGLSQPGSYILERPSLWKL